MPILSNIKSVNFHGWGKEAKLGVAVWVMVTVWLIVNIVEMLEESRNI